MKPLAQGTIQYLVLLEAVIVIALITVAMLSGFFSQASGVDPTASKMYWLSQVIGVADAAIDTTGEGEMLLINNAEDTVTITSIDIGGTSVPVNQQLSRGQKYEFDLNGVTNCSQGNASYTIRINYTTPSGLTKSVAGAKSLYVSCVDNVLISGSASFSGSDYNADNSSNIENNGGVISLTDTNLQNSWQWDALSDANIDLNAAYSSGTIVLSTS